jgi:hypothetical protein
VTRVANCARPPRYGWPIAAVDNRHVVFYEIR